jgi:hypothetical protein
MSAHPRGHVVADDVDVGGELEPVEGVAGAGAQAGDRRGEVGLRGRTACRRRTFRAGPVTFAAGDRVLSTQVRGVGTAGVDTARAGIRTPA